MYLGGGKSGTYRKTAVGFFTLTEEQRQAVGEKFLELGNIGLGGVDFWQCDGRGPA
jgi:hypothetical protein